ncbi:MAG: IS701 family transposase [Planctomycetota bacterium]
MTVSTQLGPQQTAAADGLDRFLQPFAALFRRRDQARWFQLYVRGLLHEGPRKTIEAMVRHLEPGPGAPIRDLAQALQNFLNQSPWDENLLWRRLRQAAIEKLGAQPWNLVVDEISIVKQGQHSVGVHRQYAGDNDRKENCQVAIVLTAATPTVAFPLACRLYLPRNWASDGERLHSAGVPVELHAPATRGEVGLRLLDELRAEGIMQPTVVAGSRYAATQDFRENLAARFASFLVAIDADLPVSLDATPDRFGAARSIDAHVAGAARFASHRVRLGDDQTARRWLIIEEADEGRRHYLFAGPDQPQTQQAALLLESRARAQTAWQTMKSHLGLDHFEGRSWRGFHHHAALVALAYAHRANFNETRQEPVD